MIIFAPYVVMDDERYEEQVRVDDAVEFGDAIFDSFVARLWGEVGIRFGSGPAGAYRMSGETIAWSIALNVADAFAPEGLP